MEKFCCRVNTIISLILLTLCSATADASRLTPFHGNAGEQRLSLNGKWMFNPRPEKSFWRSTLTAGWTAVQVPAGWGNQSTANDGAGYRRTFFAPERWRGQRIKLRCDGVNDESRVWVNGRLAGFHAGGMSPFEYDVTPMVIPGQINEIAVSVKGTDGGGIIRDIALHAVGPVNIADIYASAAGGGAINIIVETANDSKTRATGLQLVCKLTDSKGKTVGTASTDIAGIAAGKSEITRLRISADELKLWSAANPALYCLETTLQAGGKEIARSAAKIGVRDEELPTLRGVAVKGEPTTRATADLLRQLKQNNANFLQIKGFAPDEKILTLADSLGIYVSFDSKGVEPTTSMPDSIRRMLTVQQPQEIETMARRHPSVITGRLTEGIISVEIDPAESEFATNRLLEQADSEWIGKRAKGKASALIVDLGEPEKQTENMLWSLKKLFSPVRLSLAENVKSDGVATFNLCRLDPKAAQPLTLRWQADGKQGATVIDSANITVTLPEGARDAEGIKVALDNSEGCEIDSYEFTMRPRVENTQADVKSARALTFLEKSDAFIIVNGPTTYSISKINGLLNISSGSNSLLRGPQITLGEEAQTATRWIARKVSARHDKEVAIIEVEGYTDNAVGSLVYNFHADGQLTVTADFQPLEAANDHISPCTLTFATDKSISLMHWERKAHWSNYPAGHIAAAKGEAESGTEAFMAPKSNFYSVSLSYRNGRTIEFEGNGQQDFRIVHESVFSRIEISSPGIRQTLRLRVD